MKSRKRSPNGVVITTGNRAPLENRDILPTPPGRTKVTRRVLVNAAFTSVSNRRRPTKLVDSAGSLPMPDRLAGDMPVSLGWALRYPRRTPIRTYCFEDAIQLAI